MIIEEGDDDLKAHCHIFPIFHYAKTLIRLQMRKYRRWNGDANHVKQGIVPAFQKESRQYK